MEKSEAEAAVAEKKRMEVESNIEDRMKAAAMKAIEAFQASEELREEKIQFFFDAYNTRKQFMWDKVATQYSELDLNFSD